MIYHAKTIVDEKKEQQQQQEQNLSVNQNLNTNLQNRELSAPGQEKEALAPNEAEKEREAKIMEAAKKRLELSNAEKAANGEVLERFVPANRGLTGWKERRSDEKRLADIKKKTGANVDLYSMRILEAYQKEAEKEQENPPEPPQLADVIQEAFTWELSMQMLSPRYFWHHASEMRAMFKKAERLREALYEKGGEADAMERLLSGYTEAQKEDLALVIDTVSVMEQVFKNNMMAHGVKINRLSYHRDKIFRPDVSPEEAVDLCHASLHRLTAKDREVADPPAWIPLTKELEKAATDSDKARLIIDLEEKRRLDKLNTLTAFLKENGIDTKKEGNLRYTNVLVNGMSSFRNLKPEEIISLHKTLSRALGTNITTEEKQAFINEFEKIMGEILSWDLNMFRLDKEHLLDKESYFKQFMMLDMAFEVNNFYDKYKQFRQDPGLTFGLSEELSKEFAAKRNVLHEVNGIRRAYLTAYSSKHLENFPLAELEKMDENYFTEMMKKGENLSAEGKQDFYGTFLTNVTAFKEYRVRANTDLNKFLQNERTKAGLTGSLDQKIVEFNKEKETAALESMTDEEIAELVAKEARQKLRGSIEEIIRESGYLCMTASLLQNKQLYSQREGLANAVTSKLDGLISEFFKENLTSEYVDELLAEREKLNESLYHSYLETCKGDVPEKFLKKAGDLKPGKSMDMEKAKSEYALLMLMTDERVMRLSRLTSLIQNISPCVVMDKGKPEVFGTVFRDRSEEKRLAGANGQPEAEMSMHNVLDILTVSPSFKYLDENEVNNVIRQKDELQNESIAKYVSELFGMKEGQKGGAGKYRDQP